MLSRRNPASRICSFRDKSDEARRRSQEYFRRGKASGEMIVAVAVTRKRFLVFWLPLIDNHL
jgi:hypothetical protein